MEHRRTVTVRAASKADFMAARESLDEYCFENPILSVYSMLEIYPFLYSPCKLVAIASFMWLTLGIHGIIPLEFNHEDVKTTHGDL
jgi:hypothetical protein